MIGWCRKLARGVRQRPWRAFAILTLVVLTALGLSPVGVALWVRYHFRAAEQADQKREFVTARDHVTRCLRERPADPPTLLLAARIARRAGDLEEAQRYLEKCGRTGGGGRTLTVERALLRAQRGDLDAELEALIDRLLEENAADRPLILEVMSQQYMRSYRLSDARDSLDRWLDIDPNDVWALLRRGWVDEQLNRYDEAMEDYRRAVDLVPQMEGPRLRLALALLYGKNDNPEATKHFELMYERGQRSHPVLMGLARCRWEAGEQEEAQRLLDQLLESTPEDPEVLADLGKIAMTLNRPADAEPRLRESVAWRRTPTRPTISCRAASTFSARSPKPKPASRRP